VLIFIGATSDRILAIWTMKDIWGEGNYLAVF